MEYTTEETKSNRKKWVEALRSGKYEQTKGTLKTEDKFCCLGVACDISGLAGWTDDDLYMRRLSYLPIDVADWLGLEDREGAFRIGNELVYLSALNDKGYTFEMIANIIADEPTGLLAQPSTCT